MNTPLPTVPRTLVDALAREITLELGPSATNGALVGLLAKIDAGALAIAPTSAPPPDPKALSALADAMDKDLDALEDLLEALALTAGLAGG
jgi:hypothetical protein